MNKETPNALNCTHNKILLIFSMQFFFKTTHFQPYNYFIQMPGLKNNIYKIMAITSINDTSIPHDMQIFGYGIVQSHISFLKPYE
jgi:hypothetical protein